jgi:negative regulator of flagellin synthesis FlgM
VAKKTKKSDTSVTTPANLIDSLNFEDTAKQLETLKAHIFNTSESNQAKIQFIKEELAAGRYEIHSERIAAKILEHATVVEEPEIA